MHEDLTHRELSQLETYLQAMTPRPYAVAVSPTVTHDEAIAWVAGSIRQNPATEMHAVMDGAGDLVVAVTGNGPTSPANAAGLMVVLTHAPTLLMMAHNKLDSDQLVQTLGRHHEAGQRLIREKIATLRTPPVSEIALAKIDALEWVLNLED